MQRALSRDCSQKPLRTALSVCVDMWQWVLVDVNLQHCTFFEGCGSPKRSGCAVLS